jgi:prepilin-type N-terminal cleavage/methylation domain-containing protein
MRSQAGFSLVEMLVATAIFAAALALMLGFIAAGGRAGRSYPDRADVNQRVRVAAAMLERDLLVAGAGVGHGSPRSLADYLPPIRPARDGAEAPDPDVSAFQDRISILQVPQGGWTARLAVDMPAADAALQVNPGSAGCPGAGLCGFTPGTRAVVLDSARLGSGYDIFTVTGIASGLEHGPPNPPFWQPYTAAAAFVVPVRQRVYYLDAKGYRLMVYDGFKTALPLVDNVVSLKFSYFLDPHPAAVVLPPDNSGSCVFTATDPPVPLLMPLGTSTLSPASLEQFTDGPFCGLPPNRFDADLLRIRRVRVTVRVQAALERLRGKGPGFQHAGTSADTANSIEDFEVTFDVAPRSIRPTR